MRISRIAKRVLFYSQKGLIRFISFLNHRIYMKMYIPLLRRQGMQFTGTPRYIGVNVVFDDFKLIKLGNRVVVSDHSHFLTHDYSITTAQIAVGKIPKSDIALVRGISVGNNVFIGKKAIIMPNTTIGNDVIIGAGSVVRGEIPDNSIVIGNPCTVVGKVTDQAIKWEKLLQSENARYD